MMKFVSVILIAIPFLLFFFWFYVMATATTQAVSETAKGPWKLIYHAPVHGVGHADGRIGYSELFFKGQPVLYRQRPYRGRCSFSPSKEKIFLLCEGETLFLVEEKNESVALHEMDVQLDHFEWVSKGLAIVGQPRGHYDQWIWLDCMTHKSLKLDPPPLEGKDLTEFQGSKFIGLSPDESTALWIQSVQLPPKVLYSHYRVSITDRISGELLLSYVLDAESSSWCSDYSLGTKKILERFNWSRDKFGHWVARP